MLVRVQGKEKEEKYPMKDLYADGTTYLRMERKKYHSSLQNEQRTGRSQWVYSNCNKVIILK